jgi:phage regulator Rha-like protein
VSLTPEQFFNLVVGACTVAGSAGGAALATNPLLVRRLRSMRKALAKATKAVAELKRAQAATAASVTSMEREQRLEIRRVSWLMGNVSALLAHARLPLKPVKEK